MKSALLVMMSVSLAPPALAQTAPPHLPSDADFDQQQGIIRSLNAQMDQLDQRIAEAKAQGLKVPADLSVQRQQLAAASQMLTGLQGRAAQVRQMMEPKATQAHTAGPAAMGATLP